MLNHNKISNFKFQISNLGQAQFWHGKLWFAAGLVLLALTERLWLDLGPNIELVTLAALAATFYLGKKWGIGVALVSLAISDVVLGNTPIALFTWSAYTIGALGFSILGRFAKTAKNRVVMASVLGVGFSLWFYIWTNFGVWLTDTWGMYPHTFAGLITCYVRGLPFLKNQLLSNLIIVPVGFGLVEGILALKSALYFELIHSDNNIIHPLKLRNPV